MCQFIQLNGWRDSCHVEPDDIGVRSHIVGFQCAG